MHLESEKDRNITKRVGNTPLIKLSDKLYAKFETYNPSGSIKDRMVSYILRLNSQKIIHFLHRKSVICPIVLIGFIRICMLESPMIDSSVKCVCQLLTLGVVLNGQLSCI